MKFGTVHRILNPVAVMSPKIEIFKIQDGGNRHLFAAILKIAFSVITHRPIVRFQRNFVCGSRMSCLQRPRDKNCKFSKSNTAVGRHFENR